MEQFVNPVKGDEKGEKWWKGVIFYHAACFTVLENIKI